jgi:hypothetical protein
MNNIKRPKEFMISFWNSGKLQNESNDTFGCSVHGFSNRSEWVNPEENAAAFWSEKLSGVVLTGDFSTVLNSLQNLHFTPKACIALVKDTRDIDTFIRKYAECMPGIPLIGGGAAVASGQEAGELLPPGKEVTLLAIAEGNFVFESVNIYDKSGISLEIERVTERIFSKLRKLPEGKWQNALDFYRDQQKSRGIEESNFELMTFFDRYGRNIHCSIHGEAIRSGATLPDDNILYIGTTSYADAERKLAEFLSGENSLIFGCAGIRSLIKNPLFTGENSLAGFMFGEIFSLNDKPMFGNLMLTKLIIAQ